MEQEQISSVQSVSILRSTNNAYIRNAEIDVVGTTAITLPIVLRMFKGSAQVATETANRNGNNWSAKIRGIFEPGQYRIEVTQSGPVNVTVNLHVPPVVITSPPSGVLPAMQFSVKGSGGELGPGTVTLHNASGDGVLSAATIKADGTWDATVTLPSETQPLTFYARQKIGNYSSPNSKQVTVFFAPTPQITAPVSGTVPNRQFPVSGIGGKYGSGTITLHNAAGNAPLSTATIKTDGKWDATVTLPSETLPLTFYAKQKIGNNSSPNSNQVTVQLAALAIPGITAPANDSVQATAFTLTGNLGTVGGKVQVFKDLTDDKVGESDVLTAATWSCSVAVPVGPVSLVAKLVKDGRESERSAPRAFKIRPPKLTAVTFTIPTETTVKFSGTGHTGATVEITVVSGPGGSAPPAAQVKDGKWETTATNWKFGTYTLSAIQKVLDNANAWIESESYTFTVDKVFPDPSDVTYTKDYQPTFSGEGLTGAMVILYNPGGASKAAPDARVSNGVWSSRASEVWGPTFEREVHIHQTLNGQASPNWVVSKVTIPPLPPGMNEPVENGLSPNLGGTCWPGALLKLKYSDSATEHSVDNHNGTWSYRRVQPFEPGKTHTVTLTQTAASQTSLPTSKTFEVSAPIPQPVITLPAANAEVGRDMTVKGTSGMAGATMQLRDAQFGRDLGEPKLLTVDGEWSIELIGLEFRSYTIDAQQTRNQQQSERSGMRAFKVVLVPPVIAVPVENGKLPRTSTLEGRAMPNGRVEVWLEGVAEPLLTNILVGTDGRWKGDVTLPVGVKTIWARQFFEGQTSKDSRPLNYNVVPAAPFIETPATGEHIGRRVVVSGFGVPGDTVAVKLGGAAGTVLAQSPVLEDRTWSMTVAFDQPGGLYGVVAVASCDGFDSADSPGRPVTLGTYTPAFELPAAGHWVSHPVGFKGQGRPGSGQVVSWFNPDQVWAPDVPVTTGGWQGEAAQLLPGGGNWCRFKQTITDNADGATSSDWVESKRFEIPPAPPAES
ncbi:hypothetical protein [Pseudomonas sp. LB3P38]|uniref:hypothetical protein n=1 Tax=Pseudomonas lyxosi TaxID=3398358 RepID=UPI0039F04998